LADVSFWDRGITGGDGEVDMVVGSNRGTMKVNRWLEGY
jgi:hypothetical protein